jgi:hypothetical protein
MRTMRSNRPMRSFVFVLWMGFLVSSRLACAQNALPVARANAPTSDARVAFDALKGLGGTWSGRVTTEPPNPEIEGPIHVTMRVASRGNLLLHEMISDGQPEATLIFVENDRLTLVHYCDAGNRPRLVARSSSDGKTMAFDFMDISGSTAPAFVEHVEFTVTDTDHHMEHWTFVLPGDQRLRAHFDLTRSQSSHPNPASK